MVIITIEAYENAKVHTIKVNNKLFWVLGKSNRCSRWIRYKKHIRSS